MPPLIAAAIEAAGVTATVTIGETAVSVASVLANVAFTAALVGAEYELASGGPKSQPLQNALRQAASARFHTHGRAKVGGVIFFRESTGAGGVYGLGQVINCGLIDGVEVVYRDDKSCVNSSTAGGYASWQDPFTLTSNIETIAGSTVGYTSGVLAAAFPTIWNATHPAKGLACLYGTWQNVKAEKKQAMFPNGYPTLASIIRGECVYDPRPGTQSPTDSTTWGWSDNAMLIAAALAMHPGCLNLDPSWINWTASIDAFNACDATWTGFGGANKPFAKAWLTWKEDEEPRAVLARVLSVCDGVTYEDANGDLCFRVQTWVEPTVWFTDHDISNPVDDPEQSGISRVTVIRAKWTSAAQNYQPVDAPEARAPDAIIAARGEVVQDLDLAACPDGDQAYRLAMRTMKRLLQGKLPLTLGPRGLLAVGQRVIGINSAALGIVGVYEVLALEPSPQLDYWTADLRATTSDIYANEIAPVAPEVIAPVLIAAVIETPVISSIADTIIGPVHVIKIVVNTPTVSTLTLAGQYRATGSTGPWFTMTAVAPTILESSAVGADSYDVDIWFEAATGQESAVHATSTVSVSGIAAPSPPTAITATGGSGHASGTVTLENEAFVAAAQIWRAAHGAGFGAATTIGGPIYGAANETLSFTDTVASGTYDYFGTSINTVGVSSATATGPATVTVT